MKKEIDLLISWKGTEVAAQLSSVDSSVAFDAEQLESIGYLTGPTPFCAALRHPLIGQFQTVQTQAGLMAAEGTLFLSGSVIDLRQQTFSHITLALPYRTASGAPAWLDCGLTEAAKFAQVSEMAQRYPLLSQDALVNEYLDEKRRAGYRLLPAEAEDAQRFLKTTTVLDPDGTQTSHLLPGNLLYQDGAGLAATDSDTQLGIVVIRRQDGPVTDLLDALKQRVKGNCEEGRPAGGNPAWLLDLLSQIMGRRRD